MKILTLDNLPYELDTVPEEIDDIRYSVLDYSTPEDVDYIFMPLVFLESFNAPAAAIRIGPHQLNITFDWSEQFGYVTQNGIIQWNKDWNSNQLLFDGTWSIFPRMFGPRIDEGFRKPIKELLAVEDSIGVNSYFKYIFSTPSK